MCDKALVFLKAYLPHSFPKSALALNCVLIKQNVRIYMIAEIALVQQDKPRYFHEHHSGAAASCAVFSKYMPVS
jgi:hypothetical protein